MKEQLETAIRHYGAGEHDAAGKVCRQILLLEPRHPRALHLLSRIAIRKRRSVSATALSERTIAEVPGEARFHLCHGNALQAQGKLEDAPVVKSHAVNPDIDFASIENRYLGNPVAGLGWHCSTSQPFSRNDRRAKLSQRKPPGTLCFPGR